MSKSLLTCQNVCIRCSLPNFHKAERFVLFTAAASSSYRADLFPQLSLTLMRAFELNRFRIRPTTLNQDSSLIDSCTVRSQLLSTSRCSFFFPPK